MCAYIYITLFTCGFSRMRSEGFSFYFGGLGAWGPGGWDVFARRRFHIRNRPQPSATVRVGVALAVPLQKWSLLINGGFQRRATSFRVAGVALRDIPTCFITCQKPFRVAGAIAWFQKMTCIVRGRRSTLETSIFILRVASAAVQTCRVA